MNPPYYNQTGASGYISIRYIDTRYPEDVRTIEYIDATSGWAYIDLKSGSKSATATSTWQLAFNRYNVQTNTAIGSTAGLQPTGFMMPAISQLSRNSNQPLYSMIRSLH
ncbi:MAG: hypothetical protein E6Q25_04540 [Acinetobacter sp.]|nr:MAG: hypothetical protein E6Q25_04540 [Acinetobacter sp.]